jgi:hypothetical protein
MPSDSVILTFIFCIFILNIYLYILLKRTPFLRIQRWRKLLPFPIIINTLFFGSIALYFNSTYHAITDDISYYRGALTFTGGIFDIKTGSDFMCWISMPLRRYLGFDRPSFHVLFATMGLLGNFNFLYILTKRNDFISRKNYTGQLFMFFVMLCFPNFMVWGRIYGKDSLSLFLGSLYCIGAYGLITEQKLRWRRVILTTMPIVILYILRPHIATVFILSIIIGMYIKFVTIKNIRSRSLHIYYKTILPSMLFAALVIVALYSLKNITKKETISVENIQQSLVNSVRMGAYGGSSTALATDFKDDPNMVFSPKQIIINLFMLLFAPMPWQIRGVADALAFMSNIILFLILVRFVRKASHWDVFQKYLAVVCGLFIILLSFMTGNIGLILRQKTILLPFLFLFLFGMKSTEMIDPKRITR